MNREEKIKFLQSFSEKELAQKILIPLFESMGFKDVKYKHGLLERGKDIVFYEIDKFDKDIYIAVVVKAVDINKKRAREEVVPQIWEAIRWTCEDTVDNTQKKIHRILVVTSGKISEYARDYIFGIFESEHIAISCYQCSSLIPLLEKYMPETFWREYDYFRQYFLTMKKKFELIHDAVPVGLRESISFEQTYVPLFLTENIPRLERGISLFMEPTAEEDIFRRVTEKIYEVPEALKRFDRLLILGTPGSGKTTLLRFACLQYCRENIDDVERVSTPIILGLSELHQSNESLRDYLNTILERFDFPRAGEYIEKDLKNGKCIILMDGFDEIATREGKEQIKDLLNDFIGEYPKNRLIITSRIEGYHGEFSEFSQMKILEFDDEQIRMFIQKWFRDVQKTDYIMKKIQSNDQVYALAKNPLMMAMIAMIYEDDKKIPQRRVELYRRCVELLLSRWNRIKNIKNKFPAEKKEYILRKLALNFQISARTATSRKEILEEIVIHFPRLELNSSQKHEFLDELCNLNGILRHESLENYDFLHLSLQAYLAALEVEKTKNYDLLMEHLSDAWWEETIRLTAGINGEGTELISKIMEYSKNREHANLILAGRCIADTVGTDPKIRDRIIQQLEEVFKTPFQTFIHGEIMQVLVEIGSSEVQAFFMECLDHQDPLIREASIDALIMLNSKEALSQLVEMTRNDPEWRIRCHSLNALICLHNNVIPEVIQILLSDSEPRVREYCVKALENLEVESAVPFLKKALFDDPDRGVRSSAAWTLGKLCKEDVIHVLSEALETEKDPFVREIISGILEL